MFPIIHSIRQIANIPNIIHRALIFILLLFASGAKINFGRAYIGSHEDPRQSGFKHWEEMAANPNTFILRTHFLDNHSDIDRK